ncbi:MAG TPA: LysM peptidoglycan-binding domain-containing protein, partial [Bdellovibrionota bacterium]|nr:LysM peptidoglycan-binding domain-containing protein [Bdellovibrionota bacterium]
MTKKRLLTAISTLALLTLMQACSSGDLQDGEIQGDELPSGDAATDPVPPADGMGDLDQVAQGNPDELAPPDPNAAPLDPNAAPPLEQPPADPNAVAATAPDMPPDQAVPPAETPKETPPPVETPRETARSSGEDSDYTVQAGDTLMKIAFEHYGDLYKWKEVYELNKDKISNPNAIPRGTVLKLNPADGVQISRNGEKYLIKQGDTLGTISSDIYGTPSKWKKLWKNNRELIKDPNRIFAGFYLYYTITDGEREEADKLKENPAVR